MIPKFETVLCTFFLVFLLFFVRIFYYGYLVNEPFFFLLFQSTELMYR